MNKNTSKSEREITITTRFVEDKIDAVVNDWKEAGDYEAADAGKYLKRYIKSMAIKEANDSGKDSASEISEFEKQLIILSALGINIFHADGHRWIECRDTYYEYNFSEELKEHGIILNNKVYGGVKEAVNLVDRCFMKMYRKGIIPYGQWMIEHHAINSWGGHDRIREVEQGKGGLH